MRVRQTGWDVSDGGNPQVRSGQQRTFLDRSMHAKVVCSISSRDAGFPAAGSSGGEKTGMLDRVTGWLKGLR